LPFVRRLLDEQDDVQRRLEDVVATPVGHPEHQVRDSIPWADDDLVREENAGGRLRELREGDARDQRHAEHRDDGLERDHDMARKGAGAMPP